MISGRTRVLLVDDTLNVGGKERLLLTALRCLPRDTLDVRLCLTGVPGALGREALSLADGSLVCARRGPFSPRAVNLIRRYVRENGIEVLHCNGTVDLLHALTAVRGTGAAVLCSVHGHARGFHRHLCRFLLPACDAVLPVSGSMLSDLVESGYRARRFTVVENCWDPAFEGIGRIVRGGEPGRLRMVCVSRFDLTKDQATLVRAVGLAADGGEVTLDLAGTGNSDRVAPVSRLVRESGLGDRIRLLGTVGDVPALLQRYDAFILSSFEESFGIAAVEAMAAGLPVILSDIPPFRELTAGGEAGLLFQPGSPAQAADRIRRLRDEPDLREMLSRRSLARAADYSPARFSARLAEIYREAPEWRMRR